MSKTKKKPSRAQLEAKIARLEQRLRDGHAEESTRRVGEHWYELLEYFDASDTVRIPHPAGERAYLRGMLRDTFVVEVPAESSPEQIQRFVEVLGDNGVKPALVIRAGVRFLKLAGVLEAVERELDAAEAAPLPDLKALQSDTRADPP